MLLRTIRRPRNLFLAAAPLAVIAAVLQAPTPTGSTPTQPVAAALAFPPTLTPSPIPPTATPVPPTPEPPTPQPVATENATPTPNTGVVRVGIQVGHWKSNELPEELERLRTSTGTAAGGVREVEVNLAIGQRVADLLRSRGIEVDLLPATVPPQYVADAFVSIHADGSTNTKAHGFKLATPWRTSQASQHLLDAMTAEYASATKMPRDGAVTMNMRGYYAFSWRRHEHATARTTPAVIIETGFLTNASDRAFLTKQQDTVAKGIANGVIRYLNERDPNNGAALIPPDFKSHRTIDEGVAVRAEPSEQSRVLTRIGPDKRLMPFQERDGWFQVFVRGSSNVIGWVRRDQLVETNDPTPTPLPATDT